MNWDTIKTIVETFSLALGLIFTASTVVIQSAQFCVTSIAVIVGGLWTYKLFVQKRQKYTRLEISHQVVQKRLSGKRTLIHAIIEVKNIGDVLVILEEGELNLDKVLPLYDKYEDALNHGIDLVSEGDLEIPWPSLYTRKFLSHKAPCEIEPGEKEIFPCDFIIDNNTKTVSLYSAFRNEQKKQRGLYWAYTTIHDVDE